MLVLTGVMAMAEKQKLIDFNDLKADYNPGGGAIFSENEATLLDFRNAAGAGFSEEEIKELKTSMAMSNWEVDLASSSQTRVNQSYSYTLEAEITAEAKNFEGEPMASITVLGVRIHFPEPAFNSWAIIHPPFEIPAYMDKTELGADGDLTVTDEELGEGTKYNNLGILKNVGPIKKIEIVVSGRNFPHGIGIVIQNENNEEQSIFFGYLNYTGWKRLVWENPNYVEEVRNREMETVPLYPKSAPYIKFKGIIIYRDASQDGGDFVTYIKDIYVTCDDAVLDLEMDIEDEKLWGIMQAREDARRKAELDRLGNLHVLRYLEKKKMRRSAETTETDQ